MNNKMLYELTEEDETQLEKNIIWVFGFPNNAVSSLSKLLSKYECNLFDKPQICKELGMIKLGLTNAKTFHEWRKDPDYFFSHKYSETWKFYLRKLILNRIYAQFQELHKKIIINEPDGVGASTTISDCLPNSKLLFLVQEDNLAIKYFINNILKNRKKITVSSVAKWDENVAYKMVSNKVKKLKKVIMQAYNSKFQI